MRSVGRLDFVARRLLKSVAILLAIVVMNFLLIRLAPGDPASVIAGEAGAADEKYIAQLREQFGLDQPLTTQLAVYVGNVVRFDLGYSYRNQRTVADMVGERLPATLLLTVTAFVVALGLGVGLGVMAATRVGTWADSVITVAALGFYATPLFWVGLMAILLFSVNLGWLPAFGMQTLGAQMTSWQRTLDIAHHLVLPAMTLAVFFVAVYARLTRASMLEVQDMDFVRTARAKGLTPSRILRAHTLRNAILPVVTVIGLNIRTLIAGAVLTETVFAWPGLGLYITNSLQNADMNAVLGGTIVVGSVFIGLNLLSDLLYRLLDPRTRSR